MIPPLLAGAARLPTAAAGVEAPSTTSSARRPCRTTMRWACTTRVAGTTPRVTHRCLQCRVVPGSPPALRASAPQRSNRAQRRRLSNSPRGSRDERLIASASNKPEGSTENHETASVPFWNLGAWISQQQMTPKRWLLAVVAGCGVLFVLQRVAVIGLVGLDRLLIAALIATEEAIAAVLFSALKTFGVAGAIAAAIYALYVFVIAEDTSKKL